MKARSDYSKTTSCDFKHTKKNSRFEDLHVLKHQIASWREMTLNNWLPSLNVIWVYSEGMWSSQQRFWMWACGVYSPPRFASMAHWNRRRFGSHTTPRLASTHCFSHLEKKLYNLGVQRSQVSDFGPGLAESTVGCAAAGVVGGLRPEGALRAMLELSDRRHNWPVQAGCHVLDAVPTRAIEGAAYRSAIARPANH